MIFIQEVHRNRLKNKANEVPEEVFRFFIKTMPGVLFRSL